MQEYDLVVVGGGSGAEVASWAADMELKTAIIEKDKMGGTCLNRGCIPSKIIIHSADVIETIKKAHLFGVKSKGYEIDFKQIIRRATDFVDNEAQEIEESLKGSENPRLYKEEARFIGHKTLLVGGKETIKAEKILLASGGRPFIPNIEGLDKVDFITSNEALRLEKLPETMTVIGGGYIAAELSHFYGSLGTKISIVQRRSLLVPKEDEEVSQKFTDIFRGKYNVLTKHVPVKVEKKAGKFLVTVRPINQSVGQKDQVLESDQLLVASGWRPNSDKLDLDKTGVKTDEKGFIITDEYLETNIKGIFALGDAVGHYLLKHSANLEAAYSFPNIIDPENKIPVDYTAMPHGIFSSPQIAGVGMTEQEVRAAGMDYVVGRYEYYDTAMGKAIEDKEGFVKLIVEKGSRRILGCYIIGADATTLIHEVLLAMKTGDGTPSSITRVVHIHPALSEVIQRAAGSVPQEHVHVHE